MAGTKKTGIILILVVLCHHGSSQIKDESRAKRGLGSLIGKAILTGMKSASVSNRKGIPNRGEMLAQNPARTSFSSFTETLNDPSFSDNCPNFPGLCENKDEILKLMQQATENRKKLVEEQNVNTVNLTALKKINVKNHHILHKINETEKVLLQIINNSRSTDLELLRHMSKVFHIHRTSDASKLHFGIFVDGIVEPLEYRFSDLKRILNDRKLTELELIALQNMAETSIKSLIYALSHFNATNTQMEIDTVDVSHFLIKCLGKNMSMTHADVEILKNNSHPRYQTTAANYGLHLPKYRLVWNLVQKLAKEGWHLSGRTVQLQGNIWKLEEFESSLKFNMSMNLHQIKRKYHKTNLKFRHLSESFNFTFRKSDWDAVIRKDIENITNAIVRAISENHWILVAAKIKEMKFQYDAYIKQIAEELKGTLDERKSFPSLVKQCTEQYQDTKKLYFNVLSSGRVNALMAEALGLKVSVNYSSNTNYYENLAEKNVSNFGQEQLSRIISHNKHGLDRLQAWSNAQLIVVDYVGKATEREERVSRMHETLQSVFVFQSVQVREFGEGIGIANFMCIIALIRRDRDHYDSFSLKSIRGNCFSHNASAFTYQALKEYKNVLIEIKISDEVRSRKTEDVAAIMDAVIKMLMTHSDPRLQTEGSSFSNKDVLCLIAKLFPRKDTYGFYNLFHFRPDCKKLSTQEFLKLKLKAHKKRMELERVNTKNELCPPDRSCLKLLKADNIETQEIIYLPPRSGSKSYNGGICAQLCATLIVFLGFLKF